MSCWRFPPSRSPTDGICVFPDLPVPSVSLPQPPQPEPKADDPTPALENPPPTPPQQQSAPQADTSLNRSRAPMRKQSFGDPEADPWGSPDLHRGHNHSSYTTVPTQTNGVNVPPATRATSQFTTNSANTTRIEQPIPQRPSSYGSEGGWGGFNPNLEQSYSNPALGAEIGGDAGGFGPQPSGESAANAPANLGRSFGGGRVAGTGPEEVITVTTLAEKEGVFMFQHRNYEVASSRRNSKVVRRYSDFVWLLDCLHKRYPFRQLPLLPPKRVASELLFKTMYVGR